MAADDGKGHNSHCSKRHISGTELRPAWVVSLAVGVDFVQFTAEHGSSTGGKHDSCLRNGNGVWAENECTRSKDL